MADIASGATKNSPTTASAGAINAKPIARRVAGRSIAAEVMAPWPRPALSRRCGRGNSWRGSTLGLLQDHAFIPLGDLLEVRRERERTPVLRQVRRRDVGEELVPCSLVELR